MRIKAPRLVSLVLITVFLVSWATPGYALRPRQGGLEEQSPVTENLARDLLGGDPEAALRQLGTAARGVATQWGLLPKAAGLEEISIDEAVGYRSKVSLGRPERQEAGVELSGRGASGIDRWPAPPAPDYPSTGQLSVSTTFQASPFSGANTKDRTKQTTITAANPTFRNPDGSLPSISPATLPASRILPASANDLDSVARRPSVNIGLPTGSSVPQSLEAINPTSGPWMDSPEAGLEEPRTGMVGPTAGLEATEVRLLPKMTQSFAVGRVPSEEIWRQPEFTQQVVEQVAAELVDRGYRGRGQGRESAELKGLEDEVTHVGQEVQSEFARRKRVGIEHVAFESKGLIEGAVGPGSVTGDSFGQVTPLVSDLADPTGGLLRAEPGTGSYAVTGAGIRSLGRFPERARALVVAFRIDPAQVTHKRLRKAFNRYNARSIEELFDPELPVDELVQRVAMACRVSVSQVDVTMIESGQPDEVAVLERLKGRNPTMGLELISGGTTDDAFPAILGREDGRISVLLRRVGISPALFKTFLASAFSREGAFVVMRVVSDQVRSGFDQRYHWDPQVEKEMRRLRAEDARAGRIPRDDAEEILRGKKSFSSRMVSGPVRGSYTFLTQGSLEWSRYIEEIRPEESGRYFVQTISFQSPEDPHVPGYLWGTQSLSTPFRWGLALEIPGLLSGRSLSPQEREDLFHRIDRLPSRFMPPEDRQRLGVILGHQEAPAFLLNAGERDTLEKLTKALIQPHPGTVPVEGEVQAVSLTQPEGSGLPIRSLAIRLVEMEEPLFRVSSGKFTAMLTQYRSDSGQMTLWLPEPLVKEYFPKNDTRAVTQVILFALLTEAIGLTEREALLALSSFNADNTLPVPGEVALPDALRAAGELLHRRSLRGEPEAAEAVEALRGLLGQRFRLTGSENRELVSGGRSDQEVARLAAMSERLAELVQDWGTGMMRRYDRFLIIGQQDLGHGFRRYRIAPAHREELDASFGAPSYPRESYDILLTGDEPVALLREDPENFTLKARPYPSLRMEDQGQRDRYRASLLGCLNLLTIRSGRLVLFYEERADRIGLVLRDDERFYQTDPEVPGRKVLPFRLGELEGKRSILGHPLKVAPSERVFQLEFKLKGSASSSILVEVDPPDTTFGRGPAFLVVPKKTVLVVGFGTIGSKVAHQLRRFGFHVVVANRGLDRAQAAKNHGFPLYFLPDYTVSDSQKMQEDIANRQQMFRKAGIPWNVQETIESLLKRGGVDLIVNAVDKVTEPFLKGLYRLAPSTPILLQGGDRSDLADLVLEPSVHEVLGVDFAHYRGKRVFKIPSCNETFGSHLLAAASLIPDLGSVGGSFFYMRRHADPFSSRSDLAAGGPKIQPGSHHAPGILEIFQGVPEELRLPFRTARRTGKLDLTSTATFGPQTKVHQSVATLTVEHKDGKPVEVDLFKQALAAMGTVALIGFKELEPGRVLEVLLDEYGAPHPYALHPIGVKEKGDALEAIGLTPQESNVVTGNVMAAMALVGFVSDSDRWRFLSGLVQHLSGIAQRKLIVETSFPEMVGQERPFSPRAWPPLSTRARFEQIRAERVIDDSEFLDRVTQGIGSHGYEHQLDTFHKKVASGEATPMEIQQQISYLSILFSELSGQIQGADEFVLTRGIVPGASWDGDSHDWASGAKSSLSDLMTRVEEEIEWLNERLAQLESHEGKGSSTGPTSAGLEAASLEPRTGLEEAFVADAAGRISGVFQAEDPVQMLSSLLPQLVEQANANGNSELTTEALRQIFSSLGFEKDKRRFTGWVGRALTKGLREFEQDFEPPPPPRPFAGRGTIWTVTPSPTIDIDARGKFKGWDDPNGVLVGPGGGGINVAIALAQRGVPARPLFYHAGQTGEQLVQLVRNRGVYVGDAIKLDGDEETRVTLVTSMDKAGSLVPKGTPVTEQASQRLIAKLLDPKEGVQRGDIVVMSGSVAPGLPVTFYADLGRELLRRGATVVVDTKDKPAEEILFAQPAVTTVYSQNQFEFGKIVGIDPNDTQALIRKAREILQAQPPDQAIQEIVITLGPQGAFSVTRDRILEAPAPSVGVVSEIGAGDTSLARRVYGLWIGGETPGESFLRGIAAGTDSVTHLGTGGGTRAGEDHLAKVITLKEHVLVENPYPRGVVPPAERLRADRLSSRVTSLLAAGAYAKGYIGFLYKRYLKQGIYPQEARRLAQMELDALGQDIFGEVHDTRKVDVRLIGYEGRKKRGAGASKAGRSLGVPHPVRTEWGVIDVYEASENIILGEPDKGGSSGNSFYFPGPLAEAFGPIPDELGAGLAIFGVPQDRPEVMNRFLPSRGGRPLDPNAPVIEILRAATQANDVTFNELDVYLMDRYRLEEEYRRGLRSLERQYPRLRIVEVHHGSHDQALRAILGQKEGRVPVFVGTAGSTEAAAAYLSALLFNDVAVGLRIYGEYSKSIGDAVGSLAKTLGELTSDEWEGARQVAPELDQLPKDIPIRAIFSPRIQKILKEEIKRPDADEIVSPSGRLFHNESLIYPKTPQDTPGIRLQNEQGKTIHLVPHVRWDDLILSAATSLLLPSRILGIQEAIRERFPGYYEVPTLVVERVEGKPYVWVEPHVVKRQELVDLLPQHFPPLSNAAPPSMPEAGLEEAIGYVAVEGVIAATPAGLEERVYGVAVGLKQTAASTEFLSPSRLIAVVSGVEEVKQATALGIPPEQVVDSTRYAGLEQAKGAAIWLARETLKVLQGLEEVLVLDTAARTTGEVKAWLAGLPVAWGGSLVSDVGQQVLGLEELSEIGV